MTKKILALLLSVVMAFCLAACSGPHGREDEQVTPQAEKNGQVAVLFTSDIHCAVMDGFGFDGLMQIRETLEAQGYTTLLVDNGDAVQGEPLGTLSKGEAITQLMNAMHYDAAIPGNHEFDYGMDRFLELAEKAEFPYLSCNLTREGELIFPDHIVLESAGIRIGFVGVTTPETIRSSHAAYFQNGEGEYIYSFLQDGSGEALYSAVQEAVDAARADGADYVYLLAHLGNEAACRPWTYADVIEHTRGIDVLLDGHSHDTDQVVMKNMDGENVVRSACGSKMSGIGYSFISPENGITETGIWSWPNGRTPGELLGISNSMTEELKKATEGFEEIQNKVIAVTSVDLTIYDPVEKDPNGNPIRMIRRAETNLGDLICDAVLEYTGADIAVFNAGGIRSGIEKGDVTYGDIFKVFPFGNTVCSIRATGQQILDALEWGARAIPGESGAFLQVAGMSYEIDSTVISGCASDGNGMCTGITGERRVRNVMVGNEKLDPEKTYVLASNDYVLFSNGDGFTFFDGAEIVLEQGKLDNQMLIDYITDVLGGDISTGYTDLTGQGRITVTE